MLGFLLVSSTLSANLNLQGEKVHCVLLYGFGQDFKEEYPAVVRGSEHTIGFFSPILYSLLPNFCDSTAVANYDTNNNAWNSKILTQTACQALEFDENMENAIRVVFSISMGNLILAHALHEESCFLGERDIWVSYVAPWKGSYMPLFLKEMDQQSEHCNSAFSILLTLMKGLKRNGLYKRDYGAGARSLLPKNNKAYLAETAISRVDIAICAWEITIPPRVGIEIDNFMRKLLGEEGESFNEELSMEKNDILVPIQSCEIDYDHVKTKVVKQAANHGSIMLKMHPISLKYMIEKASRHRTSRVKKERRPLRRGI